MCLNKGSVVRLTRLLEVGVNLNPYGIMSKHLASPSYASSRHSVRPRPTQPVARGISVASTAGCLPVVRYGRHRVVVFYCFRFLSALTDLFRALVAFSGENRKHARKRACICHVLHLEGSPIQTEGG